MLIFTDYNKPLIIDSLDTPLVTRHHWVLSGTMKDFKLSNIPYIEETKGPSIEVMVEGFRFVLPASWNIMVVDDETKVLDTIPIANCSTGSHKVLLMSSFDTKVRTADIHVLDLFPVYSCYHPMVGKGTMMCHPVGPEKRRDGVENILNVLVGPHDLYSKYIKDMTAAELLY
jgi:hypothetical protein